MMIYVQAMILCGKKANKEMTRPEKLLSFSLPAGRQVFIFYLVSQMRTSCRSHASPVLSGFPEAFVSLHQLYTVLHLFLHFHRAVARKLSCHPLPGTYA